MLLERIRIRNLLSFRDAALELRSLNVLIGPNASGKSNLVDAIGLLQGAPGDFAMRIGQGGGAHAWINNQAEKPLATLECVGKKPAFRYSLSFQASPHAVAVTKEKLERSNGNGAARSKPYLQRDGTSFRLRSADAPIGSALTALSQIRHPSERDITRVAESLGGIRIYKEFQTGPRSNTRHGVSASVPGQFLDDDGGNLARVLDRLQFQGKLDALREQLSVFCDIFKDVGSTTEKNGISQAYVKEPGGPIISSRLSDGTLKFLCMLAVLLDPDPPPLVCMEEPELGLHPDAVRQIGKLLLEASARTQLVITTHSEVLIDELSSVPEAVVVCERGPDNGTRFRRLREDQLNLWLERYSLGELWRKGELGGSRW